MPWGEGGGDADENDDRSRSNDNNITTTETISDNILTMQYRGSSKKNKKWKIKNCKEFWTTEIFKVHNQFWKLSQLILLSFTFPSFFFNIFFFYKTRLKIFFLNNF